MYKTLWIDLHVNIKIYRSISERDGLNGSSSWFFFWVGGMVLFVCLWDVHGLTCKLLIGHMKQSNKEAYHAQLHVNRYNKEPMDLSS